MGQKVIITVEDVGLAGRVRIAAAFDPPMGPRAKATPAFDCAMLMLRAAADEGDNVNVTAICTATKGGTPEGA